MQPQNENILDHSGLDQVYLNQVDLDRCDLVQCDLVQCHLEQSRSDRRSRDDHGAVAAELALLLPVLVMLLFGIIQFGLAFNRLQGVHAAAREAARVGAVSPGDECGRATDALDGLNIAATCTVELSCPGERVVVVIEADTDIDIPFVGSRTVSLTGRGDFRCEV